MIDQFFRILGAKPIGAIGEATERSLQVAKDLVSKTLHWSGDSLEIASQYLVFWEEARENLQEKGKSLKDSSAENSRKFEEMIAQTTELFQGMQTRIQAWEKSTEELILQNRVLSSILGSSMDDQFRLSSIQMSFRKENQDVSTTEIVSDFQNSQKKEIILFVPGLFTEESLWKNKTIRIKERNVFSRGLGDYLSGFGYYPVYIRYNHGLHISENGFRLLNLFRDLQKQVPGTKIHIVSYSLGCLITRSFLYQAEKTPQGKISGLGKIVNIASPDQGSYLEKLGFWVGFLMEKVPITAVSLIGKIGNFRSDAIKDLSHGIIRKEDWALTSPFFRGGREYYFGELAGYDFYQAYGIFSLPNEPHLSWMGDGIVETKSLRYLNTKVCFQLPNPEGRILEIHGANHFTILSSGKLFRWLDKIFETSGFKKSKRPGMIE
jgi:pimeloyl-ACP methyl ester carboxylesterase